MVEAATGIVVDVDSQRVLNDEDSYLVFDSKQEAIAYCGARIETRPDLEFVVFDSKGRTIKNIQFAPEELRPRGFDSLLIQ